MNNYILKNALRRATAVTSSNLLSNSSAPSLAARGGKKKKGGPAAAAGPDSSDIVKIWKDRPDPVIRPTDEYPKYVQEALLPQYTAPDIIFQMYRGERLTTPKETWTLARNLRRSYIHEGNRMVKRDWEYESSDDDGEDLGQGVAFDDDDEYDSDDEDAPKRQKTEEELLMEQADK